MFKLHIPLPKQLCRRNNPSEEAEFYASLYNKAATPKRKKEVVESLLVNGAGWDILTRSCCYLNVFESETGEKFDFWR